MLFPVPRVISSFCLIQFQTLLHIEPFLETLLLGKIIKLAWLKKDSIYTSKIFSRTTVLKDIMDRRVEFSLDLLCAVCSFGLFGTNIVTKNHKSVGSMGETIYFSLNTTHCTHIFNRILKEIFGIQYFINCIWII